MTNIQALSNSVNYPVPEGQLSKILIDRNINEHDEYDGASASFDLAKADLFVLLATSPNISEGDMSINANDRDLFRNLAGAIYARHGEENPINDLVTKPKLKNRSNLW